MENNKLVKSKIISNIKEKIQASRSFIIFEYHGSNVKEIESLRQDLKSNGSELKVYKNTLTNLALDEDKRESFKPYLSGPNAIIFNYENELFGFKRLEEFFNNNSNIKIKAGLFENKLVTQDIIKKLASIPNKDGLLSMLLSCLQGPMRNLAYSLKQISEEKNK